MTTMDTPGSDLVPLLSPAQGPPDTGKIKRELERHANSLQLNGHVLTQARWWATTGLKGLAVLVVKAPVLVVYELRYFLIGFGRVTAAWSKWMACAEFIANAKEGQNGELGKNSKEIETKKSNRRKLSAIVGVLLLVGGWVAVEFFVDYAIAAGIIMLAAFDATGRVRQEKTQKLPPPKKVVLREGVPLSQITASLLETAAREVLDLGIDSPMRYDHSRREYRVKISCRDEITSEHLRAFERGMGASNYAITKRTTDVATVSEIVIRDGDPLGSVVPAPWIETGSVSISDPLDIGLSVTDVAFELIFAGEHIRVVGATGSGKTTWFMRNCIDRISACRNAAILGVDLSDGPELALWRDVIQKKAKTPAELKALLIEVCEEIDRRSAVLTRYAEDDDPSNDHLTEWCDELAEREGPAWPIACDEYALIAGLTGQLGEEIRSLYEKIIRTGRKVWISLIMLAQKTGNTDFSSTVMTTQCNTTIALPCSADDAVKLFGKTKRDAGWDPSTLSPGTKDERRDAGKCMVESPRHRTPDIYSCYAPLSAGEVKARARRRMAEGIPSMYPAHLGLADPQIVEAPVVPPILAAVDDVFRELDNPVWLPSEDLLPELHEMGWEGLSEIKLANLLRTAGVARDDKKDRRRRLDDPSGNPKAGYRLSIIQDALRAL